MMGNNKEDIESALDNYLNLIADGESKIYISPTESLSIKYNVDKISYLLYVINKISLFSENTYSSYSVLTLRKYCDLAIYNK